MLPSDTHSQRAAPCINFDADSACDAAQGEVKDLNHQGTKVHEGFGVSIGLEARMIGNSIFPSETIHCLSAPQKPRRMSPQIRARREVPRARCSNRLERWGAR